jgi:chemotaxis protein CheZ
MGPGKQMTAARRIFRIEQTAVTRREPLVDDADSALARHAEIVNGLAALRAAIADLAKPAAAASGTRRAENERPGTDDTIRVRRMLDAACRDSEAATQKILDAAEDIDQTANNLSAALKGKIEQELAQDIRDRAVQIFEACNFQDLIGQRLAAVMTALTPAEQHIAPPRAPRAPTAAPAVHGPRLDSDRDHLSQAEIDVLFRRGRRSA